MQILEEKGLLDGYPDGYFRGDRPLSRYEMAMAVARVIAKLKQLSLSVPPDKDLSFYLSKDDFKLINDLSLEFQSELDSIGVRVNNIEDTLMDLTSSITEKERVKLSGRFLTAFIGIGYKPGPENTSSVGNPNNDPEGQPPHGPAVIYDKDHYKDSYMFPGSALISTLRLTISGKISDNINAGGDLEMYSAFGEQGVIDRWGLMPPYNPLGVKPGGMNFQTNMSTLWLDTDGNWDFILKYGDFRTDKLSEHLFIGTKKAFSYGKGIKSTMPINGLYLSGTIYKKFHLESFLARNINAFVNFNDPDAYEEIYLFGARIYQGNKGWYPLAIPYNDGAGASHIFTYGKVFPGQYDNFACGIHTGYDFLDGRVRIEGAYVRIFENFASNPDVDSAGVIPKGSSNYGVKCTCSFLDNKIGVVGEFYQTSFDYNLLDKSNENYKGDLIKFEIQYRPERFRYIGKFIMVEPNYDPFGYHRTWEKVYLDNHHEIYGWKKWEYGSLSDASRNGKYRPNRVGTTQGIDWTFGENEKGHFYIDFDYFRQVKPTMITDDEYSFRKYDFMTGFPAEDGIGANIFGNQDLQFYVNDPAKGREYIISLGSRYDFGNNLYLWGMFEKYLFKRDYVNIHLDSSGNIYNEDYSLSYFYGGATYGLTDKFYIQGSFQYAQKSGTGEKGTEINWRQLIPGIGLKYDFSKSANIILDYKFFDFNDKLSGGTEDYTAGKFMTSFMVEF